MDKKPVRVLIVGNPGPRSMQLFEAFRERLIGTEVIVDFKTIEDRARLANIQQRGLYDRMILDELVDKPTKKDVGVYAAMFGQPAKTYTPPHKRKGKRK